MKTLETYGPIKEYSSWVLATCPVCGGKLKISKNPNKYSSYACYSDNCHKKQGNLIRSKLYKPSPFRQSTAFIQSTKTPKKLVKVIDPIPLNIEFSNFKNSLIFEPPRQTKEDRKLYTYYNYDDFQMVRVDSLDKDKYFYPEVNLNNTWVQSLPTEYKYNIPIYRAKYFSENIVIVEGEKTATIGQLLQLNCITFPMFSWGEIAMKNNLSQLQKGINNKKLNSILYLQDHDETGDFKAKLITHTAWSLGIPCESLNIGLYLGLDRNGYDLYDAYRERIITKKNCLEVLENIRKKNG